MIMESANVNLNYEKLYEEIQDVTNKIENFCGFSKVLGLVADKYSLELIDKLAKLSSELSNTAHELEEHLAWDSWIKTVE